MKHIPNGNITLKSKAIAWVLALCLGWLAGPGYTADALNDINKALELVQPQVQFTRVPPPVQDRYIPEGEVLTQFYLGVGDALELHIWNQRLNLSYPLLVNPEGHVFIPRLGHFSAAGLTTTALQQQIAAKIRQVQPEAVHMSLLLSRIRTIKIMVSGHVNNPGYYHLLWGSRLLEVLQRAGGVRDNGSIRQIELRRNDQVQRLDLYRFHYQGELAFNPHLTGGEHIHVPSLGPHVALLGQINQPGLYEIMPGEHLPQLLQLTGGLKPSADREHLTVWQKGLKQNTPRLETRDMNSLWPLEDGDVLYIQPRKLPVEENLVYIYGQVRQPGAIAYKQGLTLSDCLKQAGGPLDKADLATLRLTRQKQGHYETTTFNLQALLLDGHTSHDPIMMPGDILFVPEGFFAIRNINELTTLVLSSLGIVSVVLNLLPRQP